MHLFDRAALAEIAGMDGGDAVGGGGGEELVSSLAATPHYNSAILEDMCMKEHLAALHGICGDSEAFRDAIILGKVGHQYVLRFVAKHRKQFCKPVSSVVGTTRLCIGSVRRLPWTGILFCRINVPICYFS